MSKNQRYLTIYKFNAKFIATVLIKNYELRKNRSKRSEDKNYEGACSANSDNSDNSENSDNSINH